MGDDAAMNEQFPSVRWAYDFVLPSYDWAIRRFDAVQDKAQNLIAVSIGLMGGIPALATPPLDLSSYWFVGALGCFLALLGYGILARASGGVVLVHPGKLETDYLDSSEWEFKHSMIYYAAQNYDTNRRGVERKWALLNCMVILLVLQTGFLLAWLWGI